MRSNTITRTRLVVLAALGALAALVPTASADTTLPVWTCRASAGYAESATLLGTSRAEPVLANGAPSRTDPDTEFCADDATGVQTVDVPPTTPIVSLEAASASTTIAPPISPARLQTASAQAGVTDTVTISLGGLNVVAETITAQASGSCVGGQPAFTSDSTIVSLSINGTPINILNPPGQQNIPLLGLVDIFLNEQTTVTDANGTTRTQRAARIDLLALLPGDPLVRIVIGEAQVDYHGDVCAVPVPPTCPAGYTAQNPNAIPLVCLKTDTVTVTNNVPTPCGTGTAANASGVCVATATTCPNGTVRDPGSNTCVLVVQRPCPAGATADPATMVCVVGIPGNSGSGNGENGRVGSPTGPVATCGRLEMHFVRGATGNAGRSFTSVFGKRTVTRGRLVSCGANPRPIFGARVDVVHVLPNGQRRRKTGLRSREAGKLTLILPNDLRTRKIDYAYRPDLRSTRVTSRVILSLTVKNKRGRVLR